MENKKGERVAFWLAGIVVAASGFLAWLVPLAAKKSQIQGSGTTRAAIAMSTALNGLVFVGDGPCATLANAVAHDFRGKTLPEQYSPGNCYVFHIPLNISTELSAYLENRLKDSDIRVTSAPHSADRFAYLTTGGPLFQIVFKQNGAVGTLTLLQHRGTEKTSAASAAYQREDLVLRYSPPAQDGMR